jgi:hypothetical protein
MVSTSTYARSEDATGRGVVLLVAGGDHHAVVAEVPPGESRIIFYPADLRRGETGNSRDG